MMLGVRSLTSSASGEAVEPKIVAEAKIGTYKSVELGLKPAAGSCCLAPAGSLRIWVGPPLPPSFPHTWVTRIQQDPANRALCPRALPASGFFREMGDPERQK